MCDMYIREWAHGGLTCTGKCQEGEHYVVGGWHHLETVHTQVRGCMRCRC